MSFVAELRKRKVFQVAVGYLAVAWLLVEVTATILPAFDLPVWALRLVVLLFALGFPIVVLMAWALELTPEGVKVDVGTAGGRGILAVAGLLVVVALAWFFRGQLLPAPPAMQAAATESAPARQPEDDQSIAVLPLVNASNDPDQQFFSDGLSENLIDALSRFEGIKVVGRISAFQFRDSTDDSATIGRKLGVAYLLNGSVQRAGGEVRINLSLTRAADGSILWAEHYDRPYENLFTLQDDIAKAVADALRVRLAPSLAGGQLDDRPPGGSIEAYVAYLQGLMHWYEQDFPEAARYMSRAVELDPGYALAWARLSESLSTAATFWNPPPDVARGQLQESRRAVERAVQLAPGLGPAHTARAALMFYGFDSEGALAECRRAVQLAPQDGMVLNSCAYTLAGIGAVGEAIALRERLLSIEPLYDVNYLEYAVLLMASGRLDEFEKSLRIAERLSEPKPYLHLVAAVLRGDAAAARKFAMQAPAGDRDAYLALAAHIEPDGALADQALSRLLQDEDAVGSNPVLVAQIHALRGDAANAVAWLERAPTGDTMFLLNDPILLRLREDPRFIAYCKRVGLGDPGESEALDIDQIRAQQRGWPGAGTPSSV